MNRIVPFLLAVVFFCGLSADVFAQEDMGLGKRAAAQYKIYKDKAAGNILLEANPDNNVLLSDKHERNASGIKISPVKCLQKAVIEEQFVNVYDQNGEVSIMSVSAREVNIRVPCPKE